jgi:hypothetical protein
MKAVTEIPAPDYAALRDPWLGELLNGTKWELEPAEWQARYKTSRSAASAIHAAAAKRGIKATVAIRGDVLYVQALTTNGQKPPAAKRATKAAPVAKKTPAKRTTKKAAAAA